MKRPQFSEPCSFKLLPGLPKGPSYHGPPVSNRAELKAMWARWVCAHACAEVHACTGAALGTLVVVVVLVVVVEVGEG